ncbi:MAG: AtpZ/AtpI family protein [Planctomycetes bacterium]|nr:AtpZ/AtpI family protein [Planctomycetota bacterium]MCB9904210.1 AtpZ/AtpI family protein [Planctomycetota bacterium]
MPQLPPDDGRAKAFQEYGRYAGLGFQFAAAILVLGGVGWWADEKLSTKPLFLIAGVLAGATGGFLSLLKSVPGPKGGTRRKSDDPSAPR